MNRKGNLLQDTVIYVSLVLIFLSPVAIFVWSQYNGAENWADFYAKEIARVVDSAEPGDNITLDVHRGTEIALDNKVEIRDTFNFDNVNNEVCVKLSLGKKFCYHYFNDVDVVDWKVKIGLGEPQVNVLTFQVKEAVK